MEGYFLFCFFSYSSSRVIVLSHYNFIFSSIDLYVLYEIKEIITIIIILVIVLILAYRISRSTKQ